jgi:small-conductance mechanosensitive channel
VIDKYDGTVTDIGLMNTTLRLYIDETIATIPNKMFTDKEVVNITLARAKKACFYVTLSKNTNSEQIKNFIGAVKEIFIRSPFTENDSSVGIYAFDEQGFKLEIIFYIKNNQNSWDTKTAVGTEIMDIITKSNLKYGSMSIQNA